MSQNVSLSTALDANVISALLRSEATAPALATQLSQLAGQGPLVISLVVYAELLAGPAVTPEYLQRFLQATSIQLLPAPELAVWEAAGLAFGAYAERRRQSGGGSPRRILSDFLIGTQANARGDQLLTFDPQHYRLAFPQLRLLQPA